MSTPARNPFRDWVKLEDPVAHCHNLRIQSVVKFVTCTCKIHGLIAFAPQFGTADPIGLID